MSTTFDSGQSAYRFPGGAEPVIVVSSDSHIGPRLTEDLRAYCPSKYLAAFDEFAAAAKDEDTQRAHERPDGPALVGDGTEVAGASLGLESRRALNQRTAGHYDVQTRLREMDAEGVAAEVIFHGSQNDEPMPFVGMRDYALTYTDRDFELIRAGYRIYNRWMSDFVSEVPARLIGLAYVPFWDVELAIEEVTWAAGAGLRGVNFPAPRAGIEEYDNPIWEPFWAACADLGMQLANHIGVPSVQLSGPQHFAIRQLENLGWPSRRGMHRLIFAGVFERHPGLHLILTEQLRGWWTYTMRELDLAYGVPSRELRQQVPRKPSEYMTSNVFLGASFMGPATAKEAVEEGYEANVVWGSDYPHGEGTYKYPEYPGEPSMTRQCLRWAFADCSAEATRAMLQDNCIRAYGLDRTALAEVAASIGPTMDEIATPLETFPEGWHGDLFGQ